MFENPRRGRQASNFTTNVPKILDLKSSSEQIFSRKLPLGVPDLMYYAMCACMDQHLDVSSVSEMTHDLKYLTLKQQTYYLVTISFY